jgi:F-type H+-transporting ATPase subunit b
MPQLDTSTYASQVFWLFISFSILFCVLKMKIIPLFEKLYQKRWDHTHGAKQEADKFTNEAKQIDIDLENSLNSAKKRSAEILSKSDYDSKASFAKRKSDFLDSVHKRLDETKSILQKQEHEVEKNIIEGVIPLTTDIVTKTSGGVLSGDKIKNYLKINLSSLKKTLDLKG